MSEQGKIIDNRGKLTDFYGHRSVSHMEDRPYGTEYYSSEERNSLLPTSAILAGCKLLELYPARHSYGADPYVLYDRWGRILHQWPNDYVPRWCEIYDVCRSLGL